jgi:hypothetical protein
VIDFMYGWGGHEEREGFPGIDWSRGTKVFAFHSIVAAAIKLFGDEEEWKGRTGGYLCHATGTGIPRMIHVIGVVREAKALKYIGFCQEKPRRTAAHPNHWSSWQSRDLAHDEFGGSVKLADGTHLSFSGLPELGDEAVCLVAAIAFGLLTEAAARGIARISCNPYFERLLAYLKGDKTA